MTLNYLTLAAIFPVVAAATPFIVQFFKMFLDKYVLRNPNHDLIWKSVTFVTAAVVGLVALYTRNVQLHSVQDFIIVVGVVGVYGVGGGLSASALYAFLNGYLHQTPVIVPPKPALTADTPTVVTDPADQPRQPYS